MVAARLGASVLVTHGARGALLCGAGEDSVQEIAAPAVSVLDTSGAGDAFVGAFARTLAGGASALSAAESAVRCASLTVGLPGTQASFAQAAARLADGDGVEGETAAVSLPSPGNRGTGGR